jgi:hypothetical protein
MTEFDKEFTDFKNQLLFSNGWGPDNNKHLKMLDLIDKMNQRLKALEEKN